MSNCLIFAFRKLFTEGGFVVIRKSSHGWWPHALWSKDMETFEEYLPKTPKNRLLIPPPIYRGHIRVKKKNQGEKCL